MTEKYDLADIPDAVLVYLRARMTRAIWTLGAAESRRMWWSPTAWFARAFLCLPPGRAHVAAIQKATADARALLTQQEMALASRIIDSYPTERDFVLEMYALFQHLDDTKEGEHD